MLKITGRDVIFVTRNKRKLICIALNDVSSGNFNGSLTLRKYVSHFVLKYTECHNPFVSPQKSKEIPSFRLNGQTDFRLTIVHYIISRSQGQISLPVNNVFNATKLRIFWCNTCDIYDCWIAFQYTAEFGFQRKYTGSRSIKNKGITRIPNHFPYRIA